MSRYTLELLHLHEIPVEIDGSNLIHCITQPLMEERTESNIVFEHYHFLVAICQHLGAQYNTVTLHQQ